MKQIVKYTWAQFDDDINRIVDEVEQQYKENVTVLFDGVYGVPRGGIIPAVVLAHRLQLPLLSAPTKQCIIVDDICDSGTTMSMFAGNGRLRIVLHVKINKTSLVHLYGGLCRPFEWIQYPWETETSTIQ